MVPGDPGKAGPGVPRAVEEELCTGWGTATLLIRPVAENIARENLWRSSPARTNVSWIDILIHLSTISFLSFPVGPIDGSWGSWLKWSQCSQSCGGGTETRRTLCDSPAPAYGDKDCGGESSEERKCSTNTCPGLNIKHCWDFICCKYEILNHSSRKLGWLELLVHLL